MDLSRYSFECQKALHKALVYAKSLAHGVLEVEHVALAMLRQDAAPVSEFVAQRLRDYIQELLKGWKRVYGPVDTAFGKRLDLALDRAEKESLGSVVEAEELWAALVPHSNEIRAAVERLEKEELKADDFEPWPKSMAGSPESKSDKKTPTKKKTKEIGKKLDKSLREFTTDLTELAERGELDPVAGREREVRRVLEILGRKKKNNPVLIGDPGVGKSAIAEAVAIKIVSGRIPERLKGKRVLSLDVSSVLAGARYRGEFEERIKRLLAAVKQLEGQVILFIDEMHMLVGAGAIEGGIDAANMLKPALARGELHAVGATTLDEYRKYVEKDAALERRFQPVMVEEPTPAMAISILRSLKPRYEIHHGVQVSDEALDAAVHLSVRYLPTRRLPDKAIDLVDEACASMSLQIESTPKEMEEMRARIEEIQIELSSMDKKARKSKLGIRLKVELEELEKNFSKMEAIWNEDRKLLSELTEHESHLEELNDLYQRSKSGGQFEFAGQLQFEKIPELTASVKATRERLDELQSEHSFLRQTVGKSEIADVVSQWTGIPMERVGADDSDKIRTLETMLKGRIFGQDEAMDAICRTIKRSKTGVRDSSRPQGIFLFTGPTGVGKTVTARALAQALFDDSNRIVRIDMSEYLESHHASRLVGAVPGYIGYGEGGELTEPVRRRPFSVLLLDEVEKAHPHVLDILLQLFDDGRLTDGRGVTVDFRHTIVIMTSNISLSAGASGPLTEERTRQLLGDILRPELVGRIDEIVVYKKLTGAQLRRVLDRFVSELNKRLEEREFRVRVDEEFLEWLVALAYGSVTGARSLRRIFEREIADAVADRILNEPDLAKGAWLLVRDEDGGMQWRKDDLSGRLLPPPSTKTG